MDGRRRIRIVHLVLGLSSIALLPAILRAQVFAPSKSIVAAPGEVPVQPGFAPAPPDLEYSQPGHVHGFLDRVWGYADPENAEVITVHQLARLIDHLEKSLNFRGEVVVKSPDVWGQNRLTKYRSDYEEQMRSQLGNFEVILSSYQRRADLAALTSATSVGASITPQVRNSSNVTTTNVNPPAIPSAAGLIGPNGLVANANSLIGTMSPLLMPGNLTALALANKGATSGLGLEPTTLLDERSRFLYYLEQLRRINVGDDRTDMPGYGLYLVRTPVSILPGAQSIKGKGAIVTVEARHDLTPDLLANTFRNVVILDTAYYLMDAVTRGQYLTLIDPDYDHPPSEKAPPPSPITPSPPTPPKPEKRDQEEQQPSGGEEGGRIPAPQPAVAGRFTAGNPSLGGGSGRPFGGQGSGPGSEVIPTLGANNLGRLITAVRVDQDAWYRHDPSVVSWLIDELSAAHAFMREQARLGNPAFQPDVFENMADHALKRNYKALWVHRENWLRASAQARSDRVRPIDILAFALMIQSVRIDRQIKFDMQVMAERKGCVCGDPYAYTFHDLWPQEGAKRAFMAYVACKWPISVFSLDPILDQQNQLDLFSQRSELQMALAAAVATGQVSVQNASTYARRLEQDLGAIYLNRTSLGFGAGETIYGWRFYPRLQTPPTQSNPARIAGLLLRNGPGPDYALRNQKIEPGLRECYALMIVPNFVPKIRLTTVTNFFDLKTCAPEQEMKNTNMVNLGRKLQTARTAMQRLCDSGCYRPVDLELLGSRINQLEAMLPLQSFQVSLPYEGELLGSEMFSSYNAGLGPRLLTWYGEPGHQRGSIFLVGSGFTVHEMKVIVGGVTLSDPTSIPPPPGAPKKYSYDIMSRNVLRIDIPPDAQTTETNIILNYPKPEAKPSDVSRMVETNETTENTRGPLPFGLGDRTTNNFTRRTLETAKGNSRTTVPPVPPQLPNPAPAEHNPRLSESKRRKLIDIHVATPNGVSNHLLVEVPPNIAPSAEPKTLTTSVATTNTIDVTNNVTQTKTEFTTTPPGVVLPPGTFVPMGGSMPAGGTFVAPGAGTINVNPPGFQPGTIPSNIYPPQSPTPGPQSSNTQPAGDPAGVELASSTEAPRASPSVEAVDPEALPPLPVAMQPPGNVNATQAPGRTPGWSGTPATTKADPNVRPAWTVTPRDAWQGPGILPWRTTSNDRGWPASPQTAPSLTPRKSIKSRIFGESQ
jgi:hypothetical protein